MVGYCFMDIGKCVMFWVDLGGFGVKYETLDERVDYVVERVDCNTGNGWTIISVIIRPRSSWLRGCPPTSCTIYRTTWKLLFSLKKTHQNPPKKFCGEDFFGGGG